MHKIKSLYCRLQMELKAIMEPDTKLFVLTGTLYSNNQETAKALKDLEITWDLYLEQFTFIPLDLFVFT